MPEELTCWIRLDEGRRVRVRICVIEEPDLPTPLEREVQRLPAITEWADILGKLAKLEIENIEVTAP